MCAGPIALLHPIISSCHSPCPSFPFPFCLSPYIAPSFYRSNNILLRTYYKSSLSNMPWRPSGEIGLKPSSFFNVCAMCGCMFNATPRPLYSPEKTCYPLHRMLGGPQGRSGPVWKISLRTGTRFPDRSACSEILLKKYTIFSCCSLRFVCRCLCDILKGYK